MALGRNFLRKALYRPFTWVEIEPIHGQPWKESQAKAVEARKNSSIIHLLKGDFMKCKNLRPMSVVQCLYAVGLPE